jgi:hypothetical protein
MVYIRKNCLKQFSWTPDKSDTTGSQQHAEALRLCSSRNGYSAQLP